MRRQSRSISLRLSRAIGLLAAGSALPAGAANLLINSGFESPTAASGTSSVCTGWNFQLDCQRATFFNHTPGGQWSVWAKTFEPAGGGITQNVNITAGSMYTLSSQLLFESSYPSTSATTQLGLIWLDSGGNPVGTANYNNIDPSSVTTTGVWTPYQVSGTAPAGATQVQVFLGWTGGGTVSGPQSAFFDDADLEGAGTPPGNAWAINAGGDWNIGGNWANGTVPNGAGVEADFFSAISAPHTVFSDSAITVGIMNFNNANSYVIAGAGSLTLAATAGSAQVTVQQGSHKINLPLFINSNTNVNVAAGATLTIADPTTIASGVTLNKTGNVLIQAPLTMQSSSAMILNSGNTSLFLAPSMASGAKIDVKNNSLTIDYRGQTSPAATIQSQLASGYAGGSWNGSGINTSSATSNTGLGWKDDAASQSILIKYAYYGDANLSGNVDLTDFTFLAANFNGTNKNWSQGDFNYDGKVDLTDFTFLAANFNKTGPAPSLGATVPEPAALSLLGLAAAGLIARRRRV